MKKLNNYLGIIFLLFLLFWIVRIFYKNNQLKKEYEITTGCITGIEKPGWKNSGDFSLLYEYYVGNVRFNGNINYNLCENSSKDKVSSLLINKCFPVAFSKRDFGESVILITRNNAKSFSYTIIDSLLIYDSLLSCR